MTEETKAAGGASAGVSDSTQLLGCPFCGTPARLRKGMRGWLVDCDVWMEGSCEIAPTTGEHTTKEEAIAVWNRRAHHWQSPLPTIADYRDFET